MAPGVHRKLFSWRLQPGFLQRITYNLPFLKNWRFPRLSGMDKRVRGDSGVNDMRKSILFILLKNYSYNLSHLSINIFHYLCFGFEWESNFYPKHGMEASQRCTPFQSPLEHRSNHKQSYIPLSECQSRGSNPNGSHAENIKLLFYLFDVFFYYFYNILNFF